MKDGINIVTYTLPLLKRRPRNLVLLLLLFAFEASPVFATQYFVAPNGNDASIGTILLPFQTIQRAQTAAAPGDTVYVRGGSYIMQTSQVATYSSIWAYVTNLTKSGTAGNRINYWAYPGEKPVFDYTNITPAGYRINAFEVSGSYLHIKGLEVTGVQVTITTSNTQSICFDNTGSNNIFEQLSMHDGQAIGFYLTKGANNLILNCDAYRNNDYTSQSGGGVNGGNVDGFGNHPTNAGNINNVYKGCRAWFNSDDGYDCISADESTIFDSCWAFYNGYAAGFISRGDGNGFKAGGYGSTAFTSLPANIPRNTIRFCLSVRNKANGFYSNHHLSGSDWYNNTAYLNSTNYNMLNRKAKNSTDYLTDVPGYDHVIKNNISLAPRSAGSDIASYDAATCVITNNTFLNPGVTVSTNDFLSVDTALLVAPRQADGSLPTNDFMRLKPTSSLVDKGVNIGFAYNGAAPDLGCFETAAIITPVQLISFTATVSNKKVNLQWKVATEIQNKGWEIERAEVINGAITKWNKVGFVAGKGTSNQQTIYTFADDLLTPGTYQYRLKQIDLDGKYIYSNVLSVRVGSKGSLGVQFMPQPFGASAFVQYSVASKTNVALSVYNTNGQVVAELLNRLQDAGSYQESFPAIANLPGGYYILKMITGSELITKPFIKAM
jgi:hypothetical protein